MVRMSSYFVIAQNPGPSASGCQCTGSLARSHAYWSHGWCPSKASLAVRSIAGASVTSVMTRDPATALGSPLLRKRRLPVIPLAIGGLAAAGLWLRKLVVPARPDKVGTTRPRRIPDPDARPSPDGRGVRLAVNPDSGPIWRGNPAEVLRAELPAADIHELGPDDDLIDILCADPATASSPSARRAATAR